MLWFPKNQKLNELIKNPEFCNLISELASFQSISPICINNFLTNQKTCFLKTITFGTYLFDDHKLIDTMLRSKFAKIKSDKIFYRYYKTLTIKKLKKNKKRQLFLVPYFESLYVAFKFTLNKFTPLEQKMWEVMINLLCQSSFLKLLWRVVNEKRNTEN